MIFGRLSLLWRIRLLTAVVVMAVSLLGLAMVVYERINASQREFRDVAGSIVLALMPMLKNTLVVGDLATAQQAFDAIVEQESVRRITLYSPNDRRIVIDAVGPPASGQRDQPPEWFDRVVGMHVLVSSEAILVGGTEYGTLQVEMSHGKLMRDLWQSMLLFGAVGFVCLLGIVLILGLALRSGLEPLRLVTDSARRLAAGDWSARVPPVQVPEVATVAEAFNHMAENIVRREADLTHAKEAAEAANRAKATFLGTMSHEIRTPLNGIIGMTDLVLSSQPTEEQRGYLELVRSSADTLLAILNDILDYSNIDSGRLALASAPIRLDEIAHDVVDQFAFRCRNKGLATRISLSPEPMPTLLGDAMHLGQVLTNLYGNAVKFTQFGEVQLTIDVGARDGNTSRVRIAVSDTGIGVAPDKMESIFDPFSQADGSITRRFGGAGLGLAISRRLVEMMGGKLTVDSTPGSGSTFQVTIDLTCPASA